MNSKENLRNQGDPEFLLLPYITSCNPLDIENLLNMRKAQESKDIPNPSYDEVQLIAKKWWRTLAVQVLLWACSRRHLVLPDSESGWRTARSYPHVAGSTVDN